MPIISVHIGVRLLSKPETILLIFVCARKYIKAGIPLPHRPTVRKSFHLFHGMRFRLYMMTGVKASAETPNLIQARSNGLNAMSAFLISIKELPQTKLRTPRIIKCLNEIGRSSMIVLLNDE